MFKIQDTQTGKMVRDMISGKTKLFETQERAEYVAASIHRDQVLSATAWNRKRGLKWQIVKA